MTDRVFDFVVSTVRNELATQLEREQQPRGFSSFYVDMEVERLIDPAKNRAKHHRERERYWTEELEKAEKEFREKGVTIEVFDPKTGTYVHPPTSLVLTNAWPTR